MRSSARNSWTPWIPLFQLISFDIASNFFIAHVEKIIPTMFWVAHWNIWLGFKIWLFSVAWRLALATSRFIVPPIPSQGDFPWLVECQWAWIPRTSTTDRRKLTANQLTAEQTHLQTNWPPKVLIALVEIKTIEGSHANPAQSNRWFSRLVQ